jgi:hypothetical protein
MQFTFLPKVVLRMEARILQYLTHGPWNATPSSCLMALRDLGFPHEPSSLAEANIAAMLRAACASAAFPAASALVDFQPVDPDAFIVPRNPPWIQTTAVMQLKINLSDFSRRFPDLLFNPLNTLQFRARSRIRASRPAPWNHLLSIRSRRWFSDGAPNAVEHIHCNLAAACAVLPPKVVFSTIRLINNGVATSRRYQESHLDCHLCGWDQGDCIEHYIHCDVVIRFATDFLPNIGTKFGPVLGTLRSMLSMELTANEMVATVVLNDILVSTLATITQGSISATVVQLMSARLRALARSSALIRNSLNNTLFVANLP